MQQIIKKPRIVATAFLMILFLLCSVNSFGQAASTAAVLQHKTDTSITNKTAAKSITPQAVGGRIKDVIDWALGHFDTSALSGDVTAEHLIGGGSAPTAILYAASGSGASYSISGSDLAGTITLNVGTSPAAGDTVLKLIFNRAYISAPTYGNIGASNANAAQYMTNSHSVYIPNLGISTTFCYIVQSGTALGAGTTYKFYYHIIE